MNNVFPSLNGLRAFEAVARRLSIKKAAQELYVTPGAVSQQIKTLEETLGCRLLVRGHRSLRLTEDGAYIYPVLREAFRQIDAATSNLQQSRRRVLTVTVLPSFAARWLVPRLGEFQEIHPEVDVRISAEVRPVDLAAERIDLGIRLGMGVYPGLVSERMLGEVLFPVCSPALLAKGPPLEKPEHLARHTLLHDDSPYRWQLWKEAVGLGHIEPRAQITFNDASLVMAAALAGQGVALGRKTLVEDELRAGRLVRLWDLEAPYEFAYYLVYQAEVMARPQAAAFREWILAAARKSARQD